MYDEDTVFLGLTYEEGADGCTRCHWHMEGPNTRKPDGERGTEVWCGAGRDLNFYQPWECPIRLPIVTLCDSSGICLTLENFQSQGGPSEVYVLRPEIEAWLEEHAPGALVVIDYPFDYCEVTFEKPTQAVHFKLRWFE